MRTFNFSAADVDNCGGVIGYPEEGYYVIAINDGKLKRGEMLTQAHLAAAHVQGAGLKRYGPADDEIVHVRLDASGTFTEYDPRTLL